MSILGVHAMFLGGAIAELDNDPNKKVFFEYLWGMTGNEGLSATLKKLDSESYGRDLNSILLQFRVQLSHKPFPEFPAIEPYRPKEKSIRVWITINDVNFFSQDAASRHAFVKEQILDRLKLIVERFKKKKDFDFEGDKLITDVKALL